MANPIQPMAPPKAKISTKAKIGGGLGAGAAISAMIAAVLAVEGGYVNHPKDPGGETNMGITKRVAVRNGYAGPMRTLPRSVAESIYYREYLVAPGYALLVPIDAAVTEELFDTTVNMGAARPSKWFQQSINHICHVSLAIDGKVGPGTIAAYQACQTRMDASLLCRVMLDSLDAAQRAEYIRIVMVSPERRVFLNGWLKKRIGNVDRAKCGRAGL